MKTARTWLGVATLAAVSLALAEAAGAQQGAAAPPPPPSPDVFYYRTLGPAPDSPVFFEAFDPETVGAGDAIGLVGFEGDLGAKTVTAAPFSASFSTQSTRVLADGNQIRRSTTGTIARDGQGRTRRDLTLPAIGPWAASDKTPPHVIFINDPVAGAQYVLQPDRKTARKLPRPPRGRWRQGAPPSGSPLAKDITTTSLGTQTIEGVSAEGTRYTRTIPTGQIGNEKPIVITTERWYSPDLQTTVMIKRSDPRMGDTVFQLTNIQRQEPDASLFQVPSDYTVKQAGPRAGRQLRRWHRQVPPPPPPPPGAEPGQPPPPQD